ncbi:MAG: DUF4398 domain-containing protein, partial [Pseudomonadota bacterium]
MNILLRQKRPLGGKTVPVILLCSLLTACAMAPETPPAALDVRQKLTELQRDPAMASNARIELRDAEAAVELAEQPLHDDKAALAEHRIYMADRMVEIARATATTRQMEADRDLMSEERDAARLAARTLEADRARADAEASRKSEMAAAAISAEAAEEMQKQIDELEAEATERGLVLTLSDVLFETGSADLQGG